VRGRSQNCPGGDAFDSVRETTAPPSSTRNWTSGSNVDGPADVAGARTSHGDVCGCRNCPQSNASGVLGGSRRLFGLFIPECSEDVPDAAHPSPSPAIEAPETARATAFRKPSMRGSSSTTKTLAFSTGCPPLKNRCPPWHKPPRRAYWDKAFATGWPSRGLSLFTPLPFAAPT